MHGLLGTLLMFSMVFRAHVSFKNSDVGFLDDFVFVCTYIHTCSSEILATHQGQLFTSIMPYC